MARFSCFLSRIRGVQVVSRREHFRRASGTPSDSSEPDVARRTTAAGRAPPDLLSPVPACRFRFPLRPRWPTHDRVRVVVPQTRSPPSASSLPRSRSSPASTGRRRRRPHSSPRRATTSSATPTGGRTTAPRRARGTARSSPSEGAPPARATPLGPFAYPTFISVNVAGQVRQVPGALPGSGIVREPYATNDPYFWGSMGVQSNGGIWWPIGPSAILRAVAPLQPFRNDAGGQPRGDATHCGWVAMRSVGPGQEPRTSISPASTWT